MFGGNAWRIGRVGGVEINIDPSWSFIALLVAYTFYAQLSLEFEGVSVETRVVMAGVMALIFFVSILIHELAHSWMARARGIRVRGITLFLFGGATHADLETKNPTDELVIAAVGPLTSVVIAGVLWGISLVSGTGVIAYGAGRLGWLNLALAVFNLLPGFPLDGGRIFRSLAWRSSGDLLKGTRLAARTGQAIGYGLIALGILGVLFGGLIGGLWLVAVGWFLAQAAESSFLQVQMRRLLAGVAASEVMTSELVQVPAELTLQEAVDRYFMRHDYNAFPVTRDGEVVGILTLRAVRQTARDEWDTQRAGHIMEPLSDACTVGSHDPMDEVLGKLSSGEARRVLVVDDGHIRGLITPRDITAWLERSRRLGLTEKLTP